MISQNVNNVSFGAKHILNVRKIAKNGADEVFDVFLLGKEDKKFMARCSAFLDNNSRHIVKTQNNVRRASENADTSYKNFFKSFLTRLRGKQRDGISFDDTTYLMAIQNGEIITGIAETTSRVYPHEFVEKLIVTTNDKTAKNSLLYGLVTTLQKSMKNRSDASVFSIGNNFISSAKDRFYIPYKDLNVALKSLKKDTPQTTFKQINNKELYDLDDFLGTTNIETEIL